MKELHIPFGISRLSREIIEPEDALSGRKCDCLCPCCNAPLVSRHGKTSFIRTHFAHDSKHPDAKPEIECPLSPLVVLGMMLRHIAPMLTGRKILLSKYHRCSFFQCCSASDELIPIVNEYSPPIQAAHSGGTIDGSHYDLELIIEGRRYLVDFAHCDKPEKEIPGDIPPDIGGIFIIRGEDYFTSSAQDSSPRLRYSESVMNYLLSISVKTWVYHHMEREILAAVMANHKCQSAAESTSNHYSPQQSNFDFPAIQAGIEQRHYLCIFCNKEFQASTDTRPSCPDCKSHLGARLIRAHSPAVKMKS